MNLIIKLISPHKNRERHVNIVLAVCFSILIHILCLAYDPQPSRATKSTESQPFTVQLTHVLEKGHSPAHAQHSPTKKIASTSSMTQTKAPQTQNIAPLNHYSDYVSMHDVDIRALPITNIDVSMLPEALHENPLQQSLPIQLRLYIDEFGRVTHIAPISIVLAQDKMLEEALEDLLFEIRFTPAKKNRLDTKSYQDIAFDFKPSY